MLINHVYNKLSQLALPQHSSLCPKVMNQENSILGKQHDLETTGFLGLRWPDLETTGFLATKVLSCACLGHPALMERKQVLMKLMYGNIY